MFGMQTLDVILGIVFVYLLLSLACTALNEVIAQLVNRRASTLLEGIRGILASGTDHSANPVAAQAAAKAALDDVTRNFTGAALAAFNDIRAASAAYVKAANELTPALTKERDARTQLERAESSLTTALGSTGDAATVTLLQREITAAKTALSGLVDDARAKAEAAQAAELGHRNALEAFETLSPADARKLRTAQQKYDQAVGNSLAARLYDHPIILALSQPRFAGRTKTRLPSYIPARAFRAALLDVVSPGAPLTTATLGGLRTTVATMPDQIRRPFMMFIDSAGNDVDRFRTAVETWYVDSMERVSGLYKRRTQTTILAIAVGITLFTNADTLRIARALASNQSLREAVVAQAEAMANDPGADVSALLAARDTTRNSNRTGANQLARNAPQDTSSAGVKASTDDLNADTVALFRLRQVRASIDSLQAIGLPLGWAGPCTPEQVARRQRALANAAASGATITAAPATSSCMRFILPNEGWGSRIAGLVITMLAISLGAPFWFDMLNRIVNIRSAGRAPEEKPKPPEALPAATGAGR